MGGKRPTQRLHLGVGPALAWLLAATVAPALAAPAVELQKTVYVGHTAGAGCPGGEEALGTSGGPITYCFAIKNTGTSYLTSIQLVDGGIGITRADTALLSGTEPLAPGATLTLYYDDTVSFDLVNTASTTATPSDAAGVPLGLSAVTDNDTAFVNRIAPAVVFEKTVYGGHNGGIGCPGGESVTGPIGAAITYCFLARNTGDTHLGDITIDDPALGITQAQMTRLLGNEPLTPSGSNTRILYYYQTTITTDLTNSATVTANPVAFGGSDLPGVADVTATDTATVDEFTIPTTSTTTSTSTSTTSTTIQVCGCTDAIPFMAGNSASLGAGTFVAGSMGVNSELGLLKLAPHAFLADGTTLYADRIKLADHASVYNLRTNFLSTGPTTQIRGAGDALDTLPLTASLCPLVPLPTCGAGDLQITTGTSESVDLPPGDYGDVRIGTGSRLRLTGVGTFRFCSLALWEDADLIADQQVTIEVAGGVNIGTRAKIHTLSGMPLVLNVGGAKFRIGSEAQVDAAITAPGARLKVKQYGKINGCLCAGLLKTALNTDLVCIGD